MSKSITFVTTLFHSDISPHSNMRLQHRVEKSFWMLQKHVYILTIESKLMVRWFPQFGLHETKDGKVHSTFTDPIRTTITSSRNFIYF